MHRPIAITPPNRRAPGILPLGPVCQKGFVRYPPPGGGPPPYWHVVREFARCGFGDGGETTRPGGLGPPGGNHATARLHAAGPETACRGTIEQQPPRGRRARRRVAPCLHGDRIEHAAVPYRIGPVARTGDRKSAG